MASTQSPPRNTAVTVCPPEDTEGSKKPDFTHAYVMRVTLKHMDACILRSLEKTVRRTKELSQNDSSTFQLIKTIQSLTKLRDMVKSLGAIYDH